MNQSWMSPSWMCSARRVGLIVLCGWSLALTGCIEDDGSDGMGSGPDIEENAGGGGSAMDEIGRGGEGGMGGGGMGGAGGIGGGEMSDAGPVDEQADAEPVDPDAFLQGEPDASPEEPDSEFDAAPRPPQECECRHGHWMMEGEGQGAGAMYDIVIDEVCGEGATCVVNGTERACGYLLGRQGGWRIYLDQLGYVQLIFMGSACGETWTGGYATQGGSFRVQGRRVDEP